MIAGACVAFSIKSAHIVAGLVAFLSPVGWTEKSVEQRFREDIQPVAIYHLQLALTMVNPSAEGLFDVATSQRANFHVSHVHRVASKEFGPYPISLEAGLNSVDLRDTEGTYEFDVHHARIASSNGREGFIQVKKAETFLFIYVNGVEKARWTRSTVNDTNQTNPDDPTVAMLGRRINITPLLADRV